MSTKACIAVCLMAILFSACARTRYTPANASDTRNYGYSETALDSVTWQVTFAGNENTKLDIVDRYALLRSGEFTIEKGYDYFIVLDSWDDPIAHSIAIGDYISPPVFWPNPLDPKPPLIKIKLPPDIGGADIGWAEHAVTKVIRMFRGKVPADNALAYDAWALLNTMGPIVAREH